MDAQNVVLLAKHKTKELRNYLVYLRTKGEFVICSHFKTDGETVDWDWGHYYNDLLSAVMDFYKDDFEITYKFKYNYDILNDLMYKETTTEMETKALEDITHFIRYFDFNKEV